jgi:hypothetical protein
VNGFTVEHLAEERYQVLRQLADAEHAARRLRRAEAVPPWRRALARRLVAFGVGLGLPPQRRDRALRQARALLCDDC